MGGLMSPTKGCTEKVLDCVRDKSKKNVPSDLKKEICKSAAAMVDKLKDGDYEEYNGGKKVGGDKKNHKEAKKAAEELGKKMGNWFYKAYECKAKSGSSANDSNGKY